MNKEASIKEILKTLKRRKVIILVVSALSFMLFGSIILRSKSTPIYQAEVSIKVERPVSVNEMLRDSLSGSSNDYVATAASMIKSYTVLADVAKKLNLIEPNLDLDEILASNKQKLIIRDIEGRISIKREKWSSNILIVTTTWTDPKTAMKLANFVAESYKDAAFYGKNKSIIDSKKTIKERLEHAEENLKRMRLKEQEFNKKFKYITLEDTLNTSISELKLKQKKFNRLRDKAAMIKEKLQILKELQKNPDDKRSIFTAGGDSAGLLYMLNQELNTLRIKKTALAVHLMPNHPKMKEVTQGIKGVIKQMITFLKAEQKEYDKQLKTYSEELKKMKEEIALIPSQMREYKQLQLNLQNAEDIYKEIALKYEEVTIRFAEMTSDIEMVRYAVEPTRPINKHVVGGSISLAIFLSFIFGIVGGFAAEMLDSVPRRISDIEKLYGVPILATTSNWKTAESLDAVRALYPGYTDKELIRYLNLASHFLPNVEIAEQYRSIIPHILNFTEAGEENGGLFCLMSAASQEGTTTCATNLAIALSRTGRTVALVDMNLRNPSIHEQFGIKNEPGLKNVLVGDHSWDAAIRKITDLMLGEIKPDDLTDTEGMDNLFILTSGGVVENPSIYLNSIMLERMIEELTDIFDYIIVDAPPALEYSEAFIIASMADATIVVSESERLPRTAMQEFRSQLEMLKIRLIGLIVSKTES